MEETNVDGLIDIASSNHYLIIIQQKLTWLTLIFLIFGNIGNICNCFVFLRKSLRSNPCSHLLLVSSIANMIALSFSIPTSIYAINHRNPSTYSLIYCKLRLYIYHALLMISRYLMIFACIDRACLSSRQVSIRNFSQIRSARLLSISTIIFWPIAVIHLPIINTIQSGVCIMPGIYGVIYSIYVVIFAGFIPPISMGISCLITLRNLHLMRVRIHTVNIPATTRRIRQRDFHLIRMLIVQVIVYILTTTPYPLNALYVAITHSQTKSNDQQVLESFIYFITSTFLLFINPAVPFYIYILTSKAFRKEFVSSCINFRRQFLCEVSNNRGIPMLTLRFIRRIIPQQGGFQTSSVGTTRPLPDR